MTVDARILERLFATVEARRGTDPDTSVGAFFYLSGAGVGLGSVDQRRTQYVSEHFAADVSSPWRRSERGIRELVTLIRDRDEHARPWAFVSVFQSGNAFQPVLDFNLRKEAWAPPVVEIDGEPVDLMFLLIAPETSGADHLKALSQIARVLRDPTVTAKLRSLRDANAIYAVLTQEPASNAA